ncbi:MAG: hypothetical protein R3F48_16990 [Candidatus Zixiibacteriota bacterium]
MRYHLFYIFVSLVLLVLSIMLSGCCDDCDFPLENFDNKTYATVFEYRELNELFTRYGGGWTGGNGGYSIPLPDGRTLWLFGTSFLDTVYSDRTRPADAKYVRNCFVITDGSDFETLHKGTPEDPLPMIPHEDSSYFYIPLSGQVIGDTLEIICSVCPQQDILYGDNEVKGTEIVRYLLPNFELIDRTPKFISFNFPFGVDIFADSIYTFIFGTESLLFGRGACVARIPNGSFLQTWEFWTYLNWSESSQYLAPINKYISGGYSVIKKDGDYFIITLDNGNSPEISLYKSIRFPTDLKRDKTLFEMDNSYVNIKHGAIILDDKSLDDEIVLLYNSTVGRLYLYGTNADNHTISFLRIRDWK